MTAARDAKGGFVERVRKVLDLDIHTQAAHDLAAEADAALTQQAALMEQMAGALKGLDEAYCRAAAPLTKDERHEDRMRLIAARAALAAYEGAKT